jgi:predicted TIM-barrel fold metal-dependent hydrolase
MIIDVHAHVSPTRKPLPEDLSAAATQYMFSTGVEVTHYGTDEDLVNGLKAAGVSKACALPPIAGPNVDRTTKLNDLIKVSMLEYPSIEGFASINPNSNGAEEETDRVLRDESFLGLVVDPVQRFNFAGSEFWRILEIAKQHKTTIFVHSEYTENNYFDADDVNETLMSFPQLNFIFTLAKNVGYIVPEPNAYFETSHVTEKELHHALETYGNDKILYGSDFKYNFYPIGELEKLHSLEVEPEIKERILGRNAAEALRLPLIKKSSILEKLGFLRRFKLH